MKVVVAGGSGFVGGALVASLRTDGHRVIVVSRRPAGADEVGWDGLSAVDGADAVVNLAGATIAGRPWTASRKAVILSSRVETTRALAAAIMAAEQRPSVFVTSSGIDYYGDAGDRTVDERSEPGTSFLARVSVAWEAAAEGPVRHVAIRTPLVVGRGAQAITMMALPFRLFAGGRLGSGRQFFPWIQLDDLVAHFRLALEDERLVGPVNAVGPQQLRQSEAARTFGAVLHRPALLPTPSFALRALLGEQADLLLHGQRAVSTKVVEFPFRHSTLESALRDALVRPGV